MKLVDKKEGENWRGYKILISLSEPLAERIVAAAKETLNREDLEPFINGTKVLKFEDLIVEGIADVHYHKNRSKK